MTEEIKKCIECDKVHRHNDGALFCKVRAMRINENTLKPVGCKQYNPSTEDIPQAMNWNKPKGVK